MQGLALYGKVKCYAMVRQTSHIPSRPAKARYPRPRHATVCPSPARATSWYGMEGDGSRKRRYGTSAAVTYRAVGGAAFRFVQKKCAARVQAGSVEVQLNIEGRKCGRSQSPQKYVVAVRSQAEEESRQQESHLPSPFRQQVSLRPLFPHENRALVQQSAAVRRTQPT